MRISDWSSDVCSSDLFIGTAAQDLPHRLVQPLDRPAGGELRHDLRVDFRAPRVNPRHQIVEKRDFGIVILLVLDFRARPVVVEIEDRSEEHTSELQSIMRISYAVFCLKKKKNKKT